MAVNHRLSRLVMVACLWISVAPQYDPDSHLGTTPDIHEVFLGRCWDYKITKFVKILPRVKTACDDLWKGFFQSFSYRPPCSVAIESYEAYLEAAVQELPVDKVMFWSGVYSLAHRFSTAASKAYVTLEDTLIGYLANSLTWCGQDIDPGMNLTRCPSWNDCPLEASEAFWAGASKLFASKAKGKVTIMLDGSNPLKPAYRPTSIFGKYELPNMSEQVTSINVIVVHELDKPKLEVCGTGSLGLLEKEVKDRGFEYICTDNSEVVMFLLCADDPDSQECELTKLHQRGQLKKMDSIPGGRPFNAKPDDFSHYTNSHWSEYTEASTNPLAPTSTAKRLAFTPSFLSVLSNSWYLAILYLCCFSMFVS